MECRGAFCAFLTYKGAKNQLILRQRNCGGKESMILNKKRGNGRIGNGGRRTSYKQNERFFNEKEYFREHECGKMDDFSLLCSK